MSTNNPDLRELQNFGSPGAPGAIDQEILGGDLLGMLVRGLTPTEAAAAVTTNVKTLANPASMVYDVVSTAGSYTGRLKLLIGDPEVAGAPPAGYAIWNPVDNKVTFAAADAVTAANFLYARKDAVNTVTSINQRTRGQDDHA